MKYDLSKKTNRFAERTVKDFSETLFDLLGKKKFEDITVNELCNKCNYPRATFYNYFQDIYDLLDYCWENMSRQIYIEDYKNIETEERTQVLFERLYGFFEEKSETVNRIMKHNEIDGEMAESLKHFMIIKIREIISSCGCVEMQKIPLEMIIMHYSNTLQMVLEFCFLRKDTITKEEAKMSIDYLLGSLEKRGRLL
ncbi:MAG: TetR/AcrR family transcriptional regulator [Clostridium sp.]|nr:TetR/AcrR family transcriptional regulator [Clostridium sp.]